MSTPSCSGGKQQRTSSCRAGGGAITAAEDIVTQTYMSKAERKQSADNSSTMILFMKFNSQSKYAQQELHVHGWHMMHAHDVYRWEVIACRKRVQGASKGGGMRAF